MNVEQTMLDWLNGSGKVGGLTAYVDVPASRPESFITLERTGGQREWHREMALLTVYVWDTSLWNASQNANLTVSSIMNMITLPPIAGMDVLSVYRDTDPDSGQPRYAVNVQLTYAIQ